jgi:bifunctional non-homologous end joining protein LigD
MKDRPLVLKRYPDGAKGKLFFQQKAPEHAPRGVRVETVRDIDGDEVERVVGGSLATLLYTAQIGTIEVNPWSSRVGSPDSPDWLVIDLDPGPRTRFARVVAVARWVREELDRLALRGAVKTSGGTGLHIYVPLAPRTTYDAAARVAERIATRVVESHPKETTLERSLEARPASAVYVDHLQNALGKSVIAAYSARAREEATVSTPLAWEELTDDLDPRAFTIETIPARLAMVGDLWGEAMKKRNAIAKLAG